MLGILPDQHGFERLLLPARPWKRPQQQARVMKTEGSDIAAVACWACRNARAASSLASSSCFRALHADSACCSCRPKYWMLQIASDASEGDTCQDLLYVNQLLLTLYCFSDGDRGASNHLVRSELVRTARRSCAMVMLLSSEPGAAILMLVFWRDTCARCNWFYNTSNKLSAGGTGTLAAATFRWTGKRMAVNIKRHKS